MKDQCHKEKRRRRFTMATDTDTATDIDIDDAFNDIVGLNPDELDDDAG